MCVEVLPAEGDRGLGERRRKEPLDCIGIEEREDGKRTYIWVASLLAPKIDVPFGYSVGSVFSLYKTQNRFV